VYNYIFTKIAEIVEDVPLLPIAGQVLKHLDVKLWEKLLTHSREHDNNRKTTIPIDNPSFADIEP